MMHAPPPLALVPGYKQVEAFGPEEEYEDDGFICRLRPWQCLAYACSDFLNIQTDCKLNHPFGWLYLRTPS